MPTGTPIAPVAAPIAAPFVAAATAPIAPVGAAATTPIAPLGAAAVAAITPIGAAATAPIAPVAQNTPVVAQSSVQELLQLALQTAVIEQAAVGNAQLQGQANIITHRDRQSAQLYYESNINGTLPSNSSIQLEGTVMHIGPMTEQFLPRQQRFGMYLPRENVSGLTLLL